MKQYGFFDEHNRLEKTQQARRPRLNGSTGTSIGSRSRAIKANLTERT
jgi:hypothetical protein